MDSPKRLEVITTNSRIKAVRAASGKTQTEFAEALGLTKNFISLMENGNRGPSDRTISDICRVFNVNEVWLRTGVGEMHTPRSREEELAAIFAAVQIGDDAKSRLIRAMARMPDEAFPALQQFVLELAEKLQSEGPQ